MIYDFYTKKINVFVSAVPDELADLKNHLVRVLKRAGMEVLQIDTQKIADRETLMNKNKQLLYSSDCSVHILAQHPFVLNFPDGSFPVSEFQMHEARTRINSEWQDFKIFMWQPEDYAKTKKRAYRETRGTQRQGILQNMVLSNRNSPVAFAEDIRSVMFKIKPVEFDIEQTDLFFIYNAIDQESANEIIYLLSDIIKIKQLEIILSADIDYAELIAQQMKKSKMLVVYYKNTADWAIPFVQQVWKKVGGASSLTPILFIGDSNIDKNKSFKFEIQKVISIIVPHEFMPIEIKVLYDRIVD